VKKTVIADTQFKSEITYIKVIKKLIVVGTKEEINICNLNEKYNVIEITTKLAIDNNTNNCFDVWSSNLDLSKINQSISVDKKYYLGYVTNKSSIDIISIYENCFESEKVKSFNSGFESGVQNIFQNEKLNLLLIVDSNGSYIKGFSLTDFTQTCEFYRGQNVAYISSITNINDNYIAVASCNKTLHIFPLSNKVEKIEKVSSSYFGKFYNFITNPYQLNKSIMKIRLDEMNTKEEFDFFDLEFRKKGSILIWEEEEKVLTCLSYNGITYKYSLNFETLTYELKSKLTWCLGDVVKSSLFISYDDYTLDLVTINKKKLNDENGDNWKLI
jgi:hypothetical protein